MKIGAVIPVQKYGNIQPEIEISSEDRGEDLMGVGMDIIKSLFLKYSEIGGIEENNFILSVGILKKSFNEEGVGIEFEPIAHTYTYGEKKLVGATDYIKKFFKPFDVDAISSILETKWGVPQQTIRDMWASNGSLASDFGNVVHASLENYEKFRESGEIITSQKKDQEGNYCLPKHPILRSIVEGYIEITKDSKGKIVTEALVSNIKEGVCGQIDRLVILDKEKKICRVEDYKVNIDSEVKDSKNKVLTPFEDLPSTKLSKYQVQMSVYANMLQASGWTVEGLGVYVYEENWKFFELPVLSVI